MFILAISGQLMVTWMFTKRYVEITFEMACLIITQQQKHQKLFKTLV
jgi:hypothetical protein